MIVCKTEYNNVYRVNNLHIAKCNIGITESNASSCTYMWVNTAFIQYTKTPLKSAENQI